ncbi:uncharacterized protein PpBr36_09264 [Pyricularia pennisetigena]|uniref:uncharacterized protein n=1 Tax=Pyricularia pennisetigena TaxID=1578925 RepID=UPI00115429D1|nr:uncharacterized protein PpBr36_09264 [Pyricularia pennisetigena]TLS21915.1 hypothetical protein PpBr36_09264 [Pyricularia pennisetigena]
MDSPIISPTPAPYRFKYLPLSELTLLSSAGHIALSLAQLRGVTTGRPRIGKGKTARGQAGSTQAEGLVGVRVPYAVLWSGLGGRKSTHMESNSYRGVLGPAPDSGYGSGAHASALDYHGYQTDMGDHGIKLDAMDQGDRPSLLNGSYHAHQDYTRMNGNAGALDPDEAVNFFQGGNVWGSYDRGLVGFESSFSPYQLPSQSHWTTADMSSPALHQPPQAWQTAMMTPPAESYDLSRSYQPGTPMDHFKQPAEIQTDTSGYGFPQMNGRHDMFIPDSHMDAVKFETNLLNSCTESSPATPASYVATPTSSRKSSLLHQFSEDRPKDEVMMAESSVGTSMALVITVPPMNSIQSQLLTPMPVTIGDEVCVSGAHPDLSGSSPKSIGTNFTPDVVAAKSDNGQESVHMEPTLSTGKTTRTTAKERRVRAPRPPGSNRAAAKKCREKTKNNEKELEFRERNMGTLNMLLKRELEQVIREAVEWRTRLLAHAHCDNPSINNWINARAVEISENVSSASVQTSSDRMQSMPLTMGPILRLKSMKLRPGYDRQVQPQFQESQPVEEALNEGQGSAAAPSA